MQNEFKRKVALVTGASRGIGSATAIALARAGCARVLIHYHSNLAGAEETLRAVEAEGAEGLLLPGNLSTNAGIEEFLRVLSPHAGQIDILVNNAGSLVKRAKLFETTPELFDEVTNLNVKSLWMITREVARGMAAQNSGVIVNVSSIAARHGGGVGAALYSAAKAAVSCLTKGLAKELAASGIRVNAISPGTVDNDFHARFSTREMLDSVIKATPQGRLSTNEDMADVILFLCSDASRNVQGQTIEINGGAFMV